jgi:cobalt/nickel transport system ATP-binding protein
LLDEPASSLDPANTRMLEENLEKLSRQGMALMVATHDVDFAWRWAERVLLFHQGKLMGDCTPEEAFGNEALLTLCGLEQPTLYAVGKLLGLDPIPKTLHQVSAAKRA